MRYFIYLAKIIISPDNIIILFGITICYIINYIINPCIPTILSLCTIR